MAKSIMQQKIDMFVSTFNDEFMSTFTDEIYEELDENEREYIFMTILRPEDINLLILENLLSDYNVCFSELFSDEIIPEDDALNILLNLFDLDEITNTDLLNEIAKVFSDKIYLKSLSSLQRAKLDYEHV